MYSFVFTFVFISINYKFYDNTRFMSSIKFYKYHGTANDFIMIEDRDKSIQQQLSQEIIAKWCSRRFGVGADGLILLQGHDTKDFYMQYYNSDGRSSSMCGNGGRCIRYNETYKSEGINVNIAEIIDNQVSMQTYERGVEAETYSCGTGTVAVAISSLLHTHQPDGQYEVNINTKGGQLSVRCMKQNDAFEDIYLIGPAVRVFEGVLKY